ncbi:MAG: hypothetical protein GWO79_00110 [Actinobacteria bacterium]|nr:hypothetical protein [Actinomycetota bacterium]
MPITALLIIILIVFILLTHIYILA